jgi:hypothetical protein
MMRNLNVNMSEKRFNALIHGGYASQVVLPGEDPREYLELCSDLVDEWQPVGPTEEDAVLTIAKAIWRKRRIQKFFCAKIEMYRATRDHPLYAEATALRGVLELIKTKPPEEVAKGPCLLSARNAKHLREKFPRQKFESDSAWVEAIAKEINSLLLPAADFISAHEEFALRDCAEIFTDDVVKNEIAVEERLDAMIDRATKRLVQAKAMKQMLGHTSSNGGYERPNKARSRKPRASAKIVTLKPGHPHSAPSDGGHEK